MASKGYTEDLLPKRDREQGAKDIKAQRRLETEHGTFAVPQRENQGHPDGFRNNR